MKKLLTGTVTIDNAFKEVSFLFTNRHLPSDLYRWWNWERGGGVERQGIGKISEAWKKPIEHVSFLLTLIGIAIVVNSLSTKEFTSLFIWGLALFIASAVTFFVSIMYLPFGNYKEKGVWKAVKWLFNLAPMKASEFPRTRQELKAFYHNLMVDMAHLILELEKMPGGDRGLGVIAKSHLEILFEGADGFGFVRNPKEGLRPWFEEAMIELPKYRVLDIWRWMNTYSN